jgi:hypothetical protein
VVGALQAPADGEHRPGLDQAPGELARPLGVDRAHLLGPGSVLGHAVLRAAEVAQQLIAAAATAGHEVLVVPAGSDDLAGQA